MNSIANSLFDSASGLDDDTSVSDLQVSHLQDEILQQSKGIEQFIRSTTKDEDNAPLSVLKSLFTLFKSELSVNLTLRKVLVEERKKAGLSNSRIQTLFHTLHREGFKDIKNFDEIVTVIKQQTAEINILMKNLKIFKKALREERHKNKHFAFHLSELEDEISVKQMNEEENSKKLSLFNEKVKKANNEIATLNHEIIIKRNKIIELEQTIHELEQTIHEREKNINEREMTIHDLEMKVQEQLNHQKDIQNQYSQEISKIKTKSDDNKMIYFTQITSLQKELESLKSQLNQQQKHHEQEITDLHSQYFTDVELIKNELNEKIKSLQFEKEEIGNNRKDELENHQRYNETMRQTLSEKDNLSLSQSKEIMRLKAKIAELEKSDADSSLNNLTLQKKIKKLNKKIKVLQIKIKDSCIDHDNEIDQLKIACQKQITRNENSLNSSFQSKVNQLEVTIRELRTKNEEQKSEIGNLRELVRKLSFNLQQEEADNARLQATLHMKKYVEHSSPISLQINTKKRSRSKRGCNERKFEEISSEFTSSSLSGNE
ncbi:hypothetical protein TRFO_32083 [Tritrichomonas foetus]|uniref:Uncharacterized protein n=1 Tax=Tritrichomonas foetus TaxID=1144522 RepID=A0A1J4JQ08_9EUKA|nr:hypothetical protein TRFO_32083 [Tritrichomonas foetus]|eukprot:OHT01193.1 hypothetical protein TRFO_32083 [Tritrichomonas foetus]